ncbi:ENHANCER OF AG-4 protein 2-like [Spinacia oleracea]|uniref:ENHANCER OF AG-4 protein 2-like n=1 Tax=Spinacia oleracea TaxID=3562 RepID=A0ABM3QWG7_SPIOL|nr:ENHANCER OF AG-4 protein 2-like [Spinacia oleracea]
MVAIWLLCHYNDRNFDVRVQDTDETNYMDLVDDLFDDSIKQDVLIPDLFRLFYVNPSTNKRVELLNDVGLMGMWGLFKRTDTVKIWIEKANEKETSIQFRTAVKKRKDRKERKAAELRRKAEEFEREREEERRRLEREAEIQRDLEEQLANTVAVEVPVYDVEDLSVEYVRVYSSQHADCFSPGGSQPPNTQKEPSPPPREPSPPPNNPSPPPRSPSPPPNNPSPPPRSPSPPPTSPQTQPQQQQQQTEHQQQQQIEHQQQQQTEQQQHQPTEQQQQHQTEHQPDQTPPPNRAELNKGRGFRISRSHAKKTGEFVPKKRGGRPAGSRVRKPTAYNVEEEEQWDDESDDENFEESESDSWFCLLLVLLLQCSGCAGGGLGWTVCAVGGDWGLGQCGVVVGRHDQLLHLSLSSDVYRRHGQLLYPSLSSDVYRRHDQRLYLSLSSYAHMHHGQPSYINLSSDVVYRRHGQLLYLSLSDVFTCVMANCRVLVCCLMFTGVPLLSLLCDIYRMKAI